MKNKVLILLFALAISTVSFGASWSAKWIQAADCKNEVNTWQVFRKTINLATVSKQMTAKIAVDSKYWLWINGRMVVFEGGLKRGPSP